MAINIGSNFMYRGHKFLDDRLNNITSTDDLKNWSIPVPNGFEVYLNNHWYTYDTNNEFDNELGYFKIRSEIVQDFGNNEEVGISQKAITERFNSVDNEINELLEISYPISSSITVFPKSGIREVGELINTPTNPITLSWFVYRKNKPVQTKLETNLEDHSVIVNKNIGSYVANEEIKEGFSILEDNTIIWNNPFFDINGDNLPITLNLPGTFKIDCITNYKNKVLTNTVNYNFYYRRFYLISDKDGINDKITEEDIKSSFKSEFITPNNGFSDTVNFYCGTEQGKYIYILLPKTIHDLSINTVDNNKFLNWKISVEMTDLINGDVTLVRNGIGIEYTWERPVKQQKGNIEAIINLKK